MLHKTISGGLIALFLLGGTTLVSCGGSSPRSSSGPPDTTQASPTPSPKSAFEDRLDYVRKGQYTYIWVFSRQDGKPLDKTDAAFLRTNAPQVVDWVTTDDGKQVIAGTNFDLAQGNLELLKKRFVAEDYTGR